MLLRLSAPSAYLVRRAAGTPNMLPDYVFQHLKPFFKKTGEPKSASLDSRTPVVRRPRPSPIVFTLRGGYGHTKRVCRSNRKTTRRPGSRRRTCKGMEHWNSDCTSPKTNFQHGDTRFRGNHSSESANATEKSSSLSSLFSFSFLGQVASWCTGTPRFGRAGINGDSRLHSLIETVQIGRPKAA